MFTAHEIKFSQLKSMVPRQKLSSQMTSPYIIHKLNKSEVLANLLFTSVNRAHVITPESKMVYGDILSQPNLPGDIKKLW